MKRFRMNWKISLAIAALMGTCITRATAQYFQQHIDYKISARLYPADHHLRGQWNILYQNNSPDTLNEIIVHLYPNAYSSQQTAYARQQLRLGQTEFYFAPHEDRGNIDSLNFTANGMITSWNKDSINPDIGHIHYGCEIAELKNEVLKYSSQ